MSAKTGLFVGLLSRRSCLVTPCFCIHDPLLNVKFMLIHSYSYNSPVTIQKACVQRDRAARSRPAFSAIGLPGQGGNDASKQRLGRGN